MELYKNLYLDEQIKNSEEIIQMISEGAKIYNLYLICLDKKGHNLFEILESKELFKDINKNKQYILIGMCYGKENAILIIKNIFEEYVRLGKDINKMKLNFIRNK